MAAGAIHQCGVADAGGKRKSAGQGFAQADEVRYDAVVLACDQAPVRPNPV